MKQKRGSSKGRPSWSDFVQIPVTPQSTKTVSRRILRIPSDRSGEENPKLVQSKSHQ